MSEHQLPIDEITRLFWKHGAKTLTMDDIARHFSVSKKTLYQHYENKETLLRAVMKYLVDEIVKQSERSSRRFPNPVEAIVKSQDEMEIFLTETENTFIRQMGKYYPAILDEHKSNVFNSLVEPFAENISRGRQLGFYRSDFDERLYFKLFLLLYFSVDDSPLFEAERGNYDLLGVSIIDFYLGSILTEKGREVYNELKIVYE